MPELSIPYQLAWPLALALSWLGGELGHHWTRLPRISLYGLFGFVFGNLAGNYLPASERDLFMVVANVAFGLMLFELGYRINLRWLRDNPWLAASGLAESILTFAAVGGAAHWYGMAPLPALLLAALAMSTSPASVLRVINEQRAAGQVTERVLHLSALNCVLAVILFKIIIGVGVFQDSGDLARAAWSSLVVLGLSALLGALLGVAVPALLRRMGSLAADGTAAFAVGVLVLVAVTHVYLLSPIVAALSFGLVARHRRVSMARSQRNFGVLGDLLSVLLFFFVASTLKWQHVLAGCALGLPLVLLRGTVKVAVLAALARAGGISLRKGALTGLALAPMSVFAILLLEQTRRVGVGLLDSLEPLAAMALLLELAGPVLTRYALRWAGEDESVQKG